MIAGNVDLTNAFEASPVLNLGLHANWIKSAKDSARSIQRICYPTTT